LQIRPATTADIPAMMTVASNAVTAAQWSQDQYQSLFSGTGPRRMALVIEGGASLQGFLVARELEPEWEIENIAVVGAAQRRGLGSRLLGEFLDSVRREHAAAVYLEVRESNRAARALYKKWAFVESGCRPRYYADPPEDAVLYRLDFV
jgi:[ribosomal protein S18]-alanine N-acetyltransferase